MPLLIPRSTESSHWYSKSGQPVYSVPYAASNKAKAGQFRPTTLKDARLQNLLPSVTTVNKTIRNAALDNWKAEQYILAALTLPRIDGESDDAFAHRVAIDAMEQVATAANKGSAIHAAVEDYMVEGKRTDLVDLMPYCGPVYDFIDQQVEEVIGCEFVVTSRDGFAGRIDSKIVLRRGYSAFNDLAATNPDFNGVAILDLKTRKPYEGKLRSYDTDMTQLSAYLEADQITPAGGLRPTAGANLYISSTDPMAPCFKPWTADEMRHGWNIFSATLKLWCLLNNYSPAF